MVRKVRTVLWLVRGVSTLSVLAFLGLALVEILRLWAPANVPLVGPYILLAWACGAAAVALVAHALDAMLEQRSSSSG
ncbi:MAG: hypothetical protein JSR45_14130 [Proteobacteria bacterium]|nr:hypothetical protein [Pseudomonadota bacterium]